ncbi:hypothetical protein J2Z44_000199 [Clostridium punense]|uniref:Peptidase S8/S53 domain-containing protein n=1 Tax=Clostridium punense TaxID=1054297 RepID=A0ABS4JY11_9CLOT|nr:MULTISPECIES: S8 family serine peptidase [Clostridium]EQB87175.1 hypothetical protein M918_10590 [Clostridium sp. BL8]MBP2020418.1 hypothetical protein [Clostridium punense]
MKKSILVAIAIVILFCGGYLLNNKLLKDKEVSNYLQKTYELPAFEEDFPSPKKVNLMQVDLRGKDLSALDINDRSKDLFYAYFDTTTKWPSKDKMPKDYNPKEILDMGKDPGLEVRKLHKQGITGKNIGIAILDSPLKNKHKEYYDRIKHYEELFNPRTDNLMHGPAVASIAAGKTVGVAPKADIYYFAVNNTYTDKSGSSRYDFEKVAIAIDKVIELNKGLPKNKKIKVISMSMGCLPEDKGYKEFKEAVDKATKEGIFTISTSLPDTHGFEFTGAGRHPTNNPNEVSSYSAGKFWEGAIFSRKTPEQFLDSDKNCLYFPMDSRTIAGSNYDDEYTFYRYGAYSWIVPYISGLYVLACEANPEVTPELFWKTAMETSKATKVDYKSKTFEIKHVVSPVDLINKLKLLN